jgi:hypothetical protein
VLATACRAAPADPVERLLADLTGFVANKDADAILECLAPEFAGEGGLGRADVAGELRRYFALYKSVEVGLADVGIDRQPAGATVRFRASLAGKAKDIGGLAGLVPETARYRFELTLVGEGKQLKIARASWRAMEREP